MSPEQYIGCIIAAAILIVLAVARAKHIVWVAIAIGAIVYANIHWEAMPIKDESTKYVITLFALIGLAGYFLLLTIIDDLKSEIESLRKKS